MSLFKMAFAFAAVCTLSFSMAAQADTYLCKDDTHHKTVTVTSDSFPVDVQINGQRMTGCKPAEDSAEARAPRAAGGRGKVMCSALSTASGKIEDQYYDSSDDAPPGADCMPVN